MSCTSQLASSKKDLPAIHPNEKSQNEEQGWANAEHSAASMAYWEVGDENEISGKVRRLTSKLQSVWFWLILVSVVFSIIRFWKKVGPPIVKSWKEWKSAKYLAILIAMSVSERSQKPLEEVAEAAGLDMDEKMDD